MPSKKHPQVEEIDVGDTRSEIVVLLNHYIERAKRGELTGLMLVAELPRGAYEAKMTSTTNAAERIGRLAILRRHIWLRAVEEE